MKRKITPTITSISNLINIASQANDTDIQPAIQAAVNSAATGSTIVLPSGSYILGSKVTVTSKSISFTGSGTLGTVLYRSESLSDAALSSLTEMFLFNYNARTSCGITINNIYFKSQYPEIIAADGGSLALDSAITLNKCPNFKVKNCRFDYFGNGAINIHHYDDIANGLITGCTFFRNAKGWDAQGYGYGVAVYGEGLAWLPEAQFGSSNFVFIENSSFDYHRHSTAAGGCGRYAVRYCTITNNIINDTASIHAIDAHDARGGSMSSSNYFATRAVECYNNTISNTTYYGGGTINPVSVPDVRNMAECAIVIRGGESISHHNTISGYRFGMGINTQYTPWGTSYPMPYTPGYNIGTDTELGCFHYSNTFTSYDDSAHRSSSDFHDYAQGYYVANRDWHLNIKTGYTPYTYPHPLT